MTAARSGGGAVGYEADERCPPLVALAVGAQGVMLVLAVVVLIVAVTARAGGQSDAYAAWAVSASLVIAGALTALQATRLRRFGAGHILVMGPTPNYVAISVLALATGGAALLASLTAAAAACYLVLASWLPRLRRILTPAVSGTVLMLIAASVLPVALERVQEVPADAPEAAGPVTALTTLTVAVLLLLRGSGRLRLWSPLIGIASGCAAAAAFGAYDLQPVADAPWAGLPAQGAPGLDFSFGAEFWALLPAFAVVALVGGVKNIGDSVAVQRASRRKPRVVDFRLVQGSLNTNGLGILLSGLAGTPPTTVYSSTSVSLIGFTGVAARSVGYAIGALLALLALFPKLTALLLSIPSPAMGAYLVIAIGLLFASGVQTAVSDGLGARDALAVGVSFSFGMGLDNQTIGADLLGEAWAPLLDNGMLAGAIAAIAMTRIMALSSRPGRARLQTRLHASALGEIDAFLRGFASGIGWDVASAQRLRAAGEETLASLLPRAEGSEETRPADVPTSGTPSPGMPPPGMPEGAPDTGGTPPPDTPRLIVTARMTGGTVEMEFLAVFDEENLEDRLACLSDEALAAEGVAEGEVPLRLLRHYASSVHHQKFHGLDIVTVQVRADG